MNVRAEAEAAEAVAEEEEEEAEEVAEEEEEEEDVVVVVRQQLSRDPPRHSPGFAPSSCDLTSGSVERT